MVYIRFLWDDCIKGEFLEHFERRVSKYHEPSVINVYCYLEHDVQRGGFINGAQFRACPMSCILLWRAAKFSAADRASNIKRFAIWR